MKKNTPENFEKQFDDVIETARHQLRDGRGPLIVIDDIRLNYEGISRRQAERIVDAAITRMESAGEDHLLK